MTTETLHDLARRDRLLDVSLTPSTMFFSTRCNFWLHRVPN